MMGGGGGGVCCFFFFFKQKTAYEMCGRDWSSDVCSSDLCGGARDLVHHHSQSAQLKSEREALQVSLLCLCCPLPMDAPGDSAYICILATCDIVI